MSPLNESKANYDMNETATDWPNYLTDDEKKVMQMHMYMVPTTALSIIIINLAVVICSGMILKNNLEPRTTYMFLGNLALSDLAFGIILLYHIFTLKFLKSANLCALRWGIIILANFVTLYSVGFISVDRFFYIVHGLHYKKWIHSTRAKKWISFMWISGNTPYIWLLHNYFL